MGWGVGRGCGGWVVKISHSTEMLTNNLLGQGAKESGMCLLPINAKANASLTENKHLRIKHNYCRSIKAAL